jgi:Spy/CpxP family protein refolding chaperone
MRKVIFILVITLILAVAVLPASASRYERGPGAVHGYGKDITAIPDLNLTVEQKAQITLLRETFLKDVKPLRDKLFSKRGDLKLLWKDKNPNQAKILATQKQIRTLRGQIQDRATVQRLAVRMVLTSEQQDKIKAFKHAAYGPAREKFSLAKYLNLSPEQKEKMKESRSSYKSETRDLRYDLAAKRLEMHKLFTDPKTDEATLLAKQKELNSLRQQLLEKKSQMKIEWRKILTPEQITKLDNVPHGWGAKGRGYYRHQRHDG